MKKELTLSAALVNLDKHFMFASTPDKYTIFDHTKDVSLKLTTEIHGTSNFDLPIQIILSVVTEDMRVWFWGAATEAENLQIIDWFKAHRSRLTAEQFTNRDNNAKSVKQYLHLDY